MEVRHGRRIPDHRCSAAVEGFPEPVCVLPVAGWTENKLVRGQTSHIILLGARSAVVREVDPSLGGFAQPSGQGSAGRLVAVGAEVRVKQIDSRETQFGCLANLIMGHSLFASRITQAEGQPAGGLIVPHLHVRAEPDGHMRRAAAPESRMHGFVAFARNENDTFSGSAKAPEKPPDFVYLAKDDVAVTESRILERPEVTPKSVVAEGAKGIPANRLGNLWAQYSFSTSNSRGESSGSSARASVFSNIAVSISMSKSREAFSPKRW